MAALLRNVDLQAMNTLAIPARAAYFASVDSEAALTDLLQAPQLLDLPRLILGGGSNIVLSGDFPGVVLKLDMKGISCIEQDDQRLLRVAAGENWDALVRYALAQGWYGLENLIAIPGSVGAAPIQNIGAYGVELSRVLVAVSGWDLQQRCHRRLSAADCQLAYRSSIFKTALADRFIITEVELALSSRPQPDTSYTALAELLPAGEPVHPRQVAAAVDALRASKLPDYREQPNAGSFFKNPIIPQQQAERLRQSFPDLVSWPMPDAQVKLAAAC